MLSLERLSLYECSVPTEMPKRSREEADVDDKEVDGEEEEEEEAAAGAVDIGDDDDFEEPARANDDTDDDDDPMQAASDDSQPGADVAAAAAAVPRQQQPPPPPPAAKTPTNANKKDTDLCEICKKKRPGNRDSWRVIGAKDKPPDFLDGDAKTWWRRCCAEHRAMLETDIRRCAAFKGPDSTPYPVDKGYTPPADPEKKRLYFCRKYTLTGEEYCLTCKRRIKYAEKEAKKAAKNKEDAQKRMNNRVKKNARRAAKLVREARRSADNEKKKQNEKERKAERDAQKAMRDAMGEYGKPFGPPPKLKEDDRKNPDKVAEYDAALRKWEDSLTERFGSLDDQAAYTAADPSVPEVDNAERPVRADEDERSQEAKDATAWYTTNRVTEVENLDDGGCCAAKK